MFAMQDKIKAGVAAANSLVDVPDHSLHKRHSGALEYRQVVDAKRSYMRVRSAVDLLRHSMAEHDARHTSEISSEV